ncbi:unnamed protein product [Bathycoccus prasinos]
MGFVLRKNKPNDATTTQTTKKKCQRCFSLEHWTFECLLKPGDQGTYVKRQSKTEMLKKRREEEDLGKSNTNTKGGFQEFMKIGKKERREVFRDPRERRERELKRKVDALRGTKKRKKKKKSGRGSSSSSSSSRSSESSGSSSSSSSSSISSSSSSLSASSSSSLSISSGSSSLLSSGSSSSSS